MSVRRGAALHTRRHTPLDPADWFCASVFCGRATEFSDLGRARQGQPLGHDRGNPIMIQASLATGRGWVAARRLRRLQKSEQECPAGWHWSDHGARDGLAVGLHHETSAAAGPGRSVRQGEADVLTPPQPDRAPADTALADRTKASGVLVLALLPGAGCRTVSAAAAVPPGRRARAIPPSRDARYPVYSRSARRSLKFAGRLSHGFGRSSLVM